MDSAIPALSAVNLDQLAFLAFVLHQIEPNSNRNSRQAHSDHDVVRKDKFFDALAHLAICRQSDQVVAIGAAVGATGAVEIYVSETGDVDERVTKHLQFIVDALFRIQELIQTNSSPSPFNSKFIESGDVNPIAASIRQLELGVLRHSRPKVFQRINKNEQYSKFADGMSALLGTLPSDADFSYIAYLSTPKNIKKLKTMASCVRLAQFCLDDDSDDSLESVRMSLSCLHNVFVTSESLISSLGLWFRANGQMDVVHWLKKVVSIRGHFLSALNTVESVRLKQFFLEPVEVRALPNPPHAFSFTISYDSFASVLDAAGWEYTPDAAAKTLTKEEMTIDLYEALVVQLLRLERKEDVEIKVVGSPIQDSSTQKPATMFTVTADFGVHCECVVLKHLQDQPRAFDYVGLSKLSCRLCDEYFTAAGSRFRTHGTHGEVARWRCPVGDDSNTQNTMITALLSIVKAEVHKQTRPKKPDSQSTTDSGDDRPQRSYDFDALAMMNSLYEESVVRDADERNRY